MCIFLEFVSTEGCSVDNFEESDIDVGTEITFGGCNVNTLVSESSGLARDQYTLMTLWQEVRAIIILRTLNSCYSVNPTIHS